MRVIIVDDEKQGIAVLEHSLRLYCPEVEIIATMTDSLEAQECIRKLKPDLVFMDIAMPKKSGIQVLLDLSPFDFMVIFVTAHDQYLLQALRMSAVDYLLKPLQEEELIMAIRKAKDKKTNRYSKDAMELIQHNFNVSNTKQLKISLPTSNGFVIRQMSELIYCEADNVYTKFYFVDKAMIMVTKPLSYYDHLLSENGFLRCHKSYLINEDHILEYLRSDGGYVVMTNKIVIDVSKRKKEMLMEAIKGRFLH
jgi:two-component system LytT family response regulator